MASTDFGLSSVALKRRRSLQRDSLQELGALPWHHPSEVEQSGFINNSEEPLFAIRN